MKIDVFIEKGVDGTYDVHFGEQTKGLTFGLLGQGDTVKEAIADFYSSRDEIKTHYNQVGKPFPENLEFVFKYDTASFLAYYSTVLALIKKEVFLDDCQSLKSTSFFCLLESAGGLNHLLVVFQD